MDEGVKAVHIAQGGMGVVFLLEDEDPVSITLRQSEGDAQLGGPQ